jgi:ribonuclease BN (tRNA processing enzyme)
MEARQDARLHVLGSSSAVPRPGRANSGYLLRTAGAAIAVDFGSGVFSRLRAVLNPAELNAVVISHMHADHFFDLVPLRYAMRYEIEREAPLPVYLPPGGLRAAREVARPLKDDAEFFAGVLDLREYDPHQALELGDCIVRFERTVHYVPAYAMRFATPAGVFAFSADTAPCAAVREIARDADLFLCEASLGPGGTEKGKRGHLNAAEAGEIAGAAGVRHLMLTHYGASSRPQALQAAAARAFRGRITVADDGTELPLR